MSRGRGQLFIAAGGNFDPALWSARAFCDGAGILPLPLKEQPIGRVPEEAAAGLTPFSGRAAERDEARALDFFEKKVRPLLANNCYNCHSANTNAKSGLRVDDRNGLLQGGSRGPAVVPGKPEKSLLLRAAEENLPLRAASHRAMVPVDCRHPPFSAAGPGWR